MKSSLATGLLCVGGSLLAYQINSIWMSLIIGAILVTGGVLMGMDLSKD